MSALRYSAEPSALASTLNRINDQLAIQNCRRSRNWKVMAWVLGMFLAFNALLLVRGYALYADPALMQAQTIEIAE